MITSYLETYIIRKQWSDIIAQQNEVIRFYGVQEGCVIGSTVTALLLTEDRYYLLNIGDTRAYEIAEKVTQLTEDHTVIEKEINWETSQENRPQNVPFRNILTKCVGVEKRILPDMFFGKVRKNAIYMICSDGFRHHISEDEMQEHLLLRGRKNPAEMKRQEEYLVEINKQRGEMDNISVITIFTE